MGVLGAGWECRYAGARRGIGGKKGLIGKLGAIRGHWWSRGCQGV